MKFSANINSSLQSKFTHLWFVFNFVVPFDEDEKDKNVWFLDHDYLENMYGMFKKVNGKIQTIMQVMMIN